MEGSLFDRSCVKYPLFEYVAEHWPRHYEVAGIDPKSVFVVQSKHLCETHYDEHFSNAESYIRVWTGRGGYDDVFQGPVRSELQAIALHFLSISQTIGGPDTTKRVGKTILHLVVISRSIDLVKILLGRKLPFDATDFDGMSPLRLSMETADHAITRVLLDAGADVNVPDKNLRTALHHVAQYGTVNEIRLLSRNAKANVRMEDRDGETPVKKTHQDTHHGS